MSSRLRKEIRLPLHNFGIGGFAASLGAVSVEIIHHGLRLPAQISVYRPAIVGGQPILFLTAINVEPINQCLVVEFDVHSAFFVEGHREELAIDILCFSSRLGLFQGATQIDMGTHIAIEILKHLFDVGNGAVCVVQAECVFLP